MHHISKPPWVIFRTLSVTSLVTEKFRLDNTTGIRYLNPSRLLPQYDYCLRFVPTTYWDASCYGTQPQIFPYPAREKELLSAPDKA